MGDGRPNPGGDGARHWTLPLLNQLRDYRPAWLRDDLVAGLSVAAVALPTAIAYPAIVNLPPETGIYAATIPTISRATSRIRPTYSTVP